MTRKWTEKTPFHLLNRAIPLAIAIPYLLLAVQSDLRLAVPTLVGATAAVTMLLAFVLYAGEKGAIAWSPRTILLVALALRLLFVFRAPELSDDAYRYLWDGLQTLSGHNPYALAPAEIEPGSGPLARLLGQVNHPEMVTIYPPAAQILFALGAFPGAGMLGLKILTAILDILACRLLIGLLARLGQSPWRAVLYAWHPLPVLEISASGHIDGAGFLFLLAGFLSLAARPGQGSAPAIPVGSRGDRLCGVPLPFVSGLAFACAALVKVYPLLLVPCAFILLRRREMGIFGLGLLLGAGLLTVPFLPDVRNSLLTLRVYAEHWDFAGFLFKGLKAAGLSGNATRVILSCSFGILVACLYGALWSRQRPGRRIQAGGTPQASFSEGFHANSSTRSLYQATRTCYGIGMGFLLLTPTLYPWYALYLAGFLPFAGGSAGLVLSWSVFLSYRVLIEKTLLDLWIDDFATASLVWLAPATAFVLSGLARKATGGKSALAEGLGRGRFMASWPCWSKASCRARPHDR
jgi:hypothetical protein